MDVEDFFLPVTDPWGGAPSDLDQQLVEQVLAGPIPGHRDIEVAVALTELVHDEYQAYGTGGGQRLDNRSSRAVTRALLAVLARVGHGDFKLPFRDFDSFHSYWVRQGCSGAGGYQARRDLLSDLMDPLHQHLEQTLIRGAVPPKLTETALNALTDPAAIRDHLHRIERNLETDPRAAVGAAKELVESTAKVVLTRCGVAYKPTDQLQKLAHASQEALGLAPKQVDQSVESAPGLLSLLGGLLSLARGLAELRNEVGTGHGREQVPTWVHPRHARMAVGAAHVWCQFVLETLEAREATPHTSATPAP